MQKTIVRIAMNWGIIGCGFAAGGIVDLNPDEHGDRIAVVKDGKVAYLPTTRVNIGSGAVGGGACRYIRRAMNADLYVADPGLGLFQSADGGRNWSKLSLQIDGMRFISSFTILDDDTSWSAMCLPMLRINECL